MSVIVPAINAVEHKPHADDGVFPCICKHTSIIKDTLVRVAIYMACWLVCDNSCMCYLFPLLNFFTLQSDCFIYNMIMN